MKSNIGEFIHYNQPYGTVVFLVDKQEPVERSGPEFQYGSRNHTWFQAENGYVVISGKVVSGSETSRLFQHKTTRDLTGEDYSLVVPRESLLQGFHTTVAQ